MKQAVMTFILHPSSFILAEAGVAQMAEQRTFNPLVVGSTPTAGMNSVQLEGRAPR
jgi:hypothetical protein